MRKLTWLMTRSAGQIEAHEKADAPLADDPGNVEALHLRANAAAHLTERETNPARQQRFAALSADISVLQAKVPFETWPMRLSNDVRERFEPGFFPPAFTPPEAHSPVDPFHDGLLVAGRYWQRAVELMSELEDYDEPPGRLSTRGRARFRKILCCTGAHACVYTHSTLR